MADAAHALQSAARTFGRLVAPETVVVKVVLHGPNGKIATLPVPHGAGEPVTEPEPLAKPGWDFTGAVPRFDGTLVPIHGRQRDLLQRLAEAGGPLTIDGMRSAWGDYTPEESTIRWTLGKLRDSLAALFPGLEDPVPSGPAGYALSIR